MNLKPASFELSISRLIAAPRQDIFRAWTEPALLVQWWGPHGMTTPECEMDLWVGGQFRTLMRAPDGSEYPTMGVFLEIVAPQRLVFTDAFLPGWLPSGKAFMTAEVMLDEEGGKTRYTARALHWNEEDRQAHEAMGFHEGWGQSLDRLEALVTQGLSD
ncbi:Uncharacterized conserved protein YndB, AHSA1/START domain [Pseudomonas sp. NFACC32-1]|uniref:SRPBCC family protein n=1 Tax=Pseudomonas sp. NFACC32-1 TaxID=1566198 RepID=UPI000876A332|nr:SRPBCC family protein [Pseudomonas sp. NFACC32-1]SCX72159.1 Uncharacterized conserved protein YndB, AHSA1/START domain [Pseudomonas sp. NFACC32-1]